MFRRVSQLPSGGLFSLCECGLAVAGGRLALDDRRVAGQSTPCGRVHPAAARPVHPAQAAAAAHHSTERQHSRQGLQ